MIEQIFNAFALIGFLITLSWLGKKTFESFKNLGLKEVKITFESNKDFISGETISRKIKNDIPRKQLFSRNPRNKKLNNKK